MNEHLEELEIIHNKNRKKIFIIDDKYICEYNEDDIIKKEYITNKLRHLLKDDKTNHKKEILIECNDIKDAFVYCKMNKLSAQIYGPLIEYFIINKCNFIKNKSTDCCGDFNINNKNIELKISLGGIEHNKFNFVQIRFNHNIDYYIFISYYLNNYNVNINGELFIFKLNKIELWNLINKYGHYAHGTKKNLGKISINNSSNCEYAIRPKYNDNCWNLLLEYKINSLNII
jgi:hypothetical protein